MYNLNMYRWQQKGFGTSVVKNIPWPGCWTAHRVQLNQNKVKKADRPGLNTGFIIYNQNQIS
jgi:hypothetical protein